MQDKYDASDIIEVMMFSRTSINNNSLKMNFKTELKSFVITFTVAVCLVLIANWDNVTLETIKDGSIYGILFGAARAGLKGVIELLIAKLS